MKNNNNNSVIVVNSNNGIKIVRVINVLSG
jgi:hypothetical protein